MKIHRIQTTKESENVELGLFKAIAQIKTVEEAKKFFHDLCTPTELQALSDRWRVVEPVIAGKSYRQIHQETAVSMTTIGRVARCILLGAGGYKLIYQRIKKLGKRAASV